MTYPAYQCYQTNQAAPSGQAAIEAAPQTVASNQATAGAPKKEKASKSKQHLWLGRTRAQVAEDNYELALREGVYKYDPMKPAGAAPDQLFWVVETSGETNLREFKTIDEDLGPGKWERDNRFGNAYFIREAEAKK